jgi:cellulose synthase/poly-beta-1,6-N-acetylglucosamine synthase-like glycosyltransferase
MSPLMQTQTFSTSSSTLLPSVSVIVPIYNGETDLPDLLNGLLSQTYPAHRVEYLLVDNNSSDRSAALVKQASQKAARRGIRLLCLSEPDIQSSYAARNQGIRNAQGDILVFTDADCKPRPTWLANLIQAFETPGIGIVAGEVVGSEGKSLLEHYARYVKTLSQSHTLNHSFCPYGQTANLAVRRELLDQIGLFRPYLTTGGDADFCWRILRQTGTSIAFAETAIVEHHHRTTLQALASQWKRYGRSNRYLNQLYDIPLMAPTPPKRIARTLLGWLVKEMPRNSIRVLRGKLPAIALLSTPLNVYCNWFRFQGQASLPEEAKTIEWLPTPVSA